MNNARTNPLYTWYGDDFTGSTDVLERLGLAGVPTVLFTGLPNEGDLRAFADCRALGIAGQSRSQGLEWMDTHLPQMFALLREMGAAVNHYKVCSTFDSAPHVGSIGRALELGMKAFGCSFAPVVVGAPHLGRWVVFGHLFAADRRQVHRIDRHPNMQHHPVTPMNEADLRLHLALQTGLRMGLVDLAAFQQGNAQVRLQQEIARGAQAIVVDGVDQATLTETGRMVQELAAEQPLFAVGSSGLTYGLLEYWRSAGLIAAAPEPAQPAAVDRLLVLCGSCSPATARQIEWARQNGFAHWHVDPETPWDALRPEVERALAAGKSVVLYTALGAQTITESYGAAFSARLGEELRRLLLASGVRRVVVAGGDTSTHAVKQLELRALTFTASLTPGAPLCKGHAQGSPLDGLELVLKGGQMGPDNFFAWVRDGHCMPQIF
jgi:uncharacterized protein YgbK (DUF1537 family)